MLCSPADRAQPALMRLPPCEGSEKQPSRTCCRSRATRRVQAGQLAHRALAPAEGSAAKDLPDSTAPASASSRAGGGDTRARGCGRSPRARSRGRRIAPARSLPASPEQPGGCGRRRPEGGHSAAERTGEGGVGMRRSAGGGERRASVAPKAAIDFRKVRRLSSPSSFRLRAM